jgi:hypothetical protein
MIAAALLSSTLVALPQGQDTPPLFASTEPIALSLVADFEAIRSDRHDPAEERPALVVLGADASGDTVEAQLRARGDFRRDPGICALPPLRLNLKKKQADGTAFEGQDKLKIVVPCRPALDAYEQYVLTEYTIYRMYRLITEASFQVRLARVTFVDTSGQDEPFTRWAFFIEDDDALAARLGGEKLDIPEGKHVRVSYLDARQATLAAVFQYMIGNTDWADDAVHNVELVQAHGAIRVVPYDFDFSGLVNAPYAIPDPKLGTKTVRERLYRGWCRPGLEAEAILRPFRENREAIVATVTETPGVTAERADAALAYLEEFWDSIETTERAERRMFRDCRDLPR